MPKYTLFVNGLNEIVDSDPDTPLLYILRDHLELNGPKYGCGVSQCGSCSVLIDGDVSNSCVMPVSQVGDKKITTLEGLVDRKGRLHPVQEAFVKEQAAQCGYCVNGIVLATVSLLRKNPDPSDNEIKEALQLNLCRCGTHSRMLKAVKRAAKNLKS